MKSPKCGGETEEGFIPGNSGLLYGFKQVWMTKIKALGMIFENPHVAKTFRCKSCGYLESYAKQTSFSFQEKVRMRYFGGENDGTNEMFEMWWEDGGGLSTWTDD